MQILRKFIKFDTTSDAVNAQVIPANFASPSNYTAGQVGSEGTDKISSHLKGIDTKLGTLGATTGDIGHTSFSAANNQSSAANVTGLAFANGTVRSFEALVSVSVDATSDLFESFKLYGIQRGSDWMMSQSSVGDISGFTFSITSGGQVQYTSGNYSGFSSATVKFRATITQV